MNISTAEFLFLAILFLSLGILISTLIYTLYFLRIIERDG